MQDSGSLESPHAPSSPARGPTSPSPAQVRAARRAAGLTQTEAAALIYCSMRAWQEWERGTRAMHPAMWELFGVKTPQLRAKSSTSKSTKVP